MPEVFIFLVSLGLPLGSVELDIGREFIEFRNRSSGALVFFRELRERIELLPFCTVQLSSIPMYRAFLSGTKTRKPGPTTQGGADDRLCPVFPKKVIRTAHEGWQEQDEQHAGRGKSNAGDDVSAVLRHAHRVDRTGP